MQPANFSEIERRRACVNQLRWPRPERDEAVLCRPNEVDGERAGDLCERQVNLLGDRRTNHNVSEQQCCEPACV